MCSLLKNPQMHDSMKRLWDAARSECARTRVTTMVELGRALEASSATMTNWKKRGVSKAGAIAAERVFGCSTEWVMSGTGTMFPAADQNPATTGINLGALLDGITVHQDEKTIAWEDLMQLDATGQLPERFRLAMPDDSMEPRTPKGTVLVLDKAATPHPGHGILVRDGHGRYHIRRYQQGAGHRWTAQPVNSAYAALDSDQDHLRLIAVVVGLMSGLM